MAELYQAFRITGIANKETFASGISSSPEFVKTLLEVWVNVSGYADNTFGLWHEKKKFCEIPDYLLSTDANSGGTNTPYSTQKILKIPVHRFIAIGQTIQATLLCGGTAKNVQGVYVYEETA